MPVPAAWNGHELNGMKLPGIGYATYRLTVLLKDSIAGELALKFFDMGTAYAVFVNGKKILSVGQVGLTPEATVPGYLPQIVDFALNANRLEFIYQVSNFHHHRGGAWELLYLGTDEQLNKIRERRLALDLILFGSILIMGLYHLTLFLLRKNDVSLCFFGLLCLGIAIRLLTTVERYLLHIFPGINWELFVKVEYLSVYLGVPIFALFVYKLFPRNFHKPAVALIVAVDGVLAVIVALAPAKIFTQTLVFYQLFTMLCLLYALSVLILGAARKHEGTAVILFGFLFLSATVINDVLDANGLIQTGHFVQVGLFIFIFSHAYLLSSRYARAFTTIDLQRGELKRSQEELRNLSAHLEHLREEERAMIAREIHDELGQVLSTLKMDLGTLENHFPKGQKILFEITQSMSDLIYLTIQRVKRISQELRPSVLDHLTFPQAVAWQIDEFMKTTGISCQLAIRNAEDLQLPPNAANALFRVLQEALTNIIRHAEAKQVSVSMEKTDAYVVLEIQDNGKGITNHEMADPQSFGLIGMRERIHHLNGQIEIKSGASSGTTIVCTIPTTQALDKTPKLENRPRNWNSHGN